MMLPPPSDEAIRQSKLRLPRSEPRGRSGTWEAVKETAKDTVRPTKETDHE